MRAPLLILLLSGAVFAGCAGLPSGTGAAPEPNETLSTAGDPEPLEFRTQAGAPSLRVITIPERATVYVDGRRVGTSPVQLTDLDPGEHLVQIRKQGYYEARQWVEISTAGTLTVHVTLLLITGYLDVDVTPETAQVIVGDRVVTDGFAELPVGTHRLHAQLFGYEPHTETISISERRLTRVSIDLEPAPFKVSGFEAWRAVFSPLNPGTIGTTRLSYRVSGPGNGELLFRDAAGRVVRRVAQGPFDDWSQEYRWDGTDDRGRFLPDGDYAVELVAAGTDRRVERTGGIVTIDRTRLVRYRSVWGATAGMLYAPVGPSLPAGQAQLSVQAAVGTLDAPPGAIRIPGRMGLRAGLGAGFELFVYGGLSTATTPERERVSLGGAVAWDGLSLPVGAASIGVGLNGGAMYQWPDDTAGPSDPGGDRPGLFISAPLTLRVHGYTVGLAPEYRHSFPRSPGSVGALRWAIAADVDAVTVGISGLVQSAPLSDGISLAVPILMGAEAHWILPRSSVAVSAFSLLEIGDVSRVRVLGGLGIGMLF